MSINVNDKNLGHATAYAYYKAGGGTMTEAEFTEFMADFGTASQTAVEAAQAALASKNAAQTAATTATTKASEATTAATTATTKAGEASTSASTATSAKDTAVSASQTATSKATEATTAAATATSAATTATTAKDDAVSAKTAAQTAQTGAETAAASVQSSAAQIQTNADDISELKEDLCAVTVAIEQGYWAITSGTATSSGYWCRSKDYIPKDISIKALNDVLMYPLAYDKLTGAYIGTWNGSEFSTTYVQTAYILDFTVINWIEKYPDYIFKLDFYRRNGPTVNPSYVAQNVSISSILTDISVLNDRTLSAFASVKTVNHRGYNTIAPENTLPAFELSGKLGYKYVETDVAFTSDGVPVLMHDATINRTARNADGTALTSDVNIADITYEQALEYDYGIWKGAQWVGTKIPTFEEFMYCCKAYNLHPWIELKQVDTAEQVALLISIIKKYGMEEHVTFISFLYDALALVKAQWDSVELGYNGTVSNANNLKTDKNRVFMIFDRTSSASTYAGAISAGYQICFYAPDTVAQLTAIQTAAYDSILTNVLLPVQIADAVKGKYDETNA